MPADTDTDIALGAKHLLNARAAVAESLDPMSDIEQPFRDRLGFDEATRRMVAAESEGSDESLAFVLSELEGL